MGISSGLKKAASKVVNKFGGSITFRRVTTGIYNPSTGTMSELKTDSSIKGVLDGVTKAEVNDFITQEDKKLTIAAKDITFTPTNKDRIVIAGVEFRIIAINTNELDNTPITFDLFLR
tara:strand:- start:916 stop:1269 length:354 start_codon:yes stop_codon:yes gene_type:complete